MNILILDDSRTRHYFFARYLMGNEGVVLHASYTATDAIRSLAQQPWDVIFLDHDLEESGEHCGNGSEVVEWILANKHDYPSKEAIHCVHSMNLPASQYMLDVLRSAGIQPKRCTGAWEEVIGLQHLSLTGEWSLPHRHTDPLEFE